MKEVKKIFQQNIYYCMYQIIMAIACTCTPEYRDRKKQNDLLLSHDTHKEVEE